VDNRNVWSDELHALDIRCPLAPILRLPERTQLSCNVTAAPPVAADDIHKVSVLSEIVRDGHSIAAFLRCKPRGDRLPEFGLIVGGLCWSCVGSCTSSSTQHQGERKNGFHKTLLI
jgi:hypothetical protein